MKQKQELKGEPFITVAFKVPTLKIARQVAASTGEKMYEVWHRVIVAEWNRIQKGNKNL